MIADAMTSSNHTKLCDFSLQRHYPTLLPETSTGVRSCFSSASLPRETQTRPFRGKCYINELQAFIKKSEDALEDIKSSAKQTTEYRSLWTVSRGKSILDHENCPTKTGQRSPADILPLVASMRRELTEAIERNSASSGASSEIQLENETLRQSLQEQIKLANEVRADVMQCLYGTRTLSHQSLAIHSQQIELEHRIEELQWETHDWESRCRRVEHPCMPRTHNATNYLVDKGLLDVNGAIKDIHVTYFQMSIDQIIHGIHAGVPQRVAEAIKQVVISVGRITRGLTDDTRRKLGDILGRVSLGLDSLLIEAEGVDKDEGSRSLSRLEANASKLTTAVIDLLRMVKIKPERSNMCFIDRHAVLDLDKVKKDNPMHGQLKIKHSIQKNRKDMKQLLPTRGSDSMSAAFDGSNLVIATYPNDGIYKLLLFCFDARCSPIGYQSCTDTVEGLVGKTSSASWKRIHDTNTAGERPKRRQMRSGAPVYT